MRKTMLILALMAFSSFGFHNFAITPDSARIGIDTLTCTGSFEHIGDTLTVASFFQDVNHNGVYDAGTDIDEMHGGNSQIIDGNKSAAGKDGPLDTVADGLLNLKLTTDNSPFNSPGYFIFIFTSDGIFDTAGFKLLQTKTTTFISGTATGPAAVAAKNIAIRAQFSDAITRSGFAEVTILTDTLGAYVMYLDTTYRGKLVQLQYSNDGGAAVPTTWIIPPQIDTLLTDSLKNMNFVFTAASHFVKGVVRDDHGSVVKNAPCYLNDSANTTINFTTDTLGRFLVGVLPRGWGIFLQWWNFPGYLANDQTNRFVAGSSTDTVHFNWVLRKADTVISGTVTDDSLVLQNRNMQIQPSGRIADSTFRTGVNITSPGAYKIHVCTAIDTYSVTASSGNLPNKFYIYPTGYPAVHYGATACNFSVLKGAAAIGGMVQDTLGHSIDNCQILIADTAQKIYFQFQENNSGFKQTVPAGTYMIGFSGFGQAIGMDVSGTAGPITITSSSKDTTVMCVARVKATGLRRNANGGFGLAPFSFSSLHSPASASQAFAFSTPIAGRARLVLFDLEGRTVATLLNRNVTAGSYRVNWDADAQIRLLPANATYIAKFDFLGARTFGAVKKFVLVR